MPIVGEIRMWAAGTFVDLPYGWLFCDGARLEASKFPDLSKLIGRTYDPTQAKKYINLPDLRSRVPVGYGGDSQTPPLAAGLTLRAIGATGGEETHLLATAEMPLHQHTITDSGHSHTFTDPGHSHGTVAYVTNGSGTEYVTTAGNKGTATNGTSASATNITVDSATVGIATTDANGSSQAHNNMQPWICVNFIIRVLP